MHPSLARVTLIPHSEDFLGVSGFLLLEKTTDWLVCVVFVVAAF